MSDTKITTAELAKDRLEDFYERIGVKNMRPLWELLRGIVPDQPRTKARPVLWHKEDYIAGLREAGELISAEEAERRVLVFENPGLAGQIRITQSLYAGVQMVLPGEHAPSHRHTQSALRFVLEGDGAITNVNGQDIRMAPGDLVITPNWTWHEHVNPSDKPMIWLDGLDVPMITMLDAGFAQEHPGRKGRTLAEGVPVPYGRTCHYPYKAMRHQLEAARLMAPADPCLGWQIRYRDPVDGLDAMPTMTTFLQLMDAGFESQPHRATDGTIVVAVSGAGTTVVDGESLAWKAGDVFVMPAWKWRHHQVDAEAVLFSFSDRGVQEKLALWREERG